MPKRKIDVDSLRNKDTFTKQEVADILFVYTNCITSTIGKALATITLSKKGLEQHRKYVEDLGNEPLDTLVGVADEDNFDARMITKPEVIIALTAAVQASTMFARNFADEELGIKIREQKEISTYIDMDDATIDKAEFSDVIRSVSDDILDGSTEGTYSQWAYTVDNNHAGAWIVTFTHPDHKTVKAVMVDKNEIDNDINTIKHLQEQFGGITGATSNTIH